MFFPNLVAFTSESETCKMKRCMQGDIEIHDDLSLLEPYNDISRNQIKSLKIPI